MTRPTPKQRRGWQLGMAIALGVSRAISLLGCLAIAFVGSRAIAQITPDDTLGSESSIVTPNVDVRDLPAERIDGGAVRGANLFHSFSDFNVGENLRVYFANPTGIENILSRVTGTNISNILGTLGVDGGANLFLLNPNGIIFGANATLDISGSFVASTADSVVFGDGLTFSANNPEAPPLLAINVPIGLQYGANPSGSVENAGNLAVGKDLTLSGASVRSTGQLEASTGNLRVEAVAGDAEVQQVIAQTATLSASNNLILEESQLQTTGDMTLQADNTVRVRDSVETAFLAQSGGNLLIEGSQGIDIFALNNPSSGFFSGGDMVLRSANTVQGDAHYTAGGSFRIEQLTGSLGKLSSPDDPIIRASGDVSFDSYTGASLHIFAGGSVTIPGTIKITGADTTNFIDEDITIVEKIPSTNGTTTNRETTVSINGSARPTLDVRAGTTAFGTAGITGDTTGFKPGVPNTGGTGKSANITIGDIVIAAPNGVVLLTNQYHPNTLSGNIKVDSIDTSSDSGNGGSVFIDSSGDITLTRFIDTSSTFKGQGSLDTELFLFDSLGALLASSDDSSTSSGAGGSTTSLDSYINYVFSQNGDYVIGVGAFNSNASNGSIVGNALNNGSYTLHASIENHALGSDGTVNESESNNSRAVAQNINSFFSQTANPNIESSDTIPHVSILGIGEGTFDYYLFTATAESRGIFDIDATFSSGNAGNILLNAADAVNLPGSRISTLGGNITATGQSVSLTDGATLEARTISSGNAGNIQINALGFVQISGVNPNTGSPTEVSTSSDAADSGRGGDIIVNVPDGNLTISNGAFLNATTSSGSQGGNIRVTVDTLDLIDGGKFLATTYGRGNAGDITINATGKVTISGSAPNFDPPPSPFDNLPATATLTSLDIDSFNQILNSNIESSTTISHTTIAGNGNNTFAYYSFGITTTGSLGIFDIDTTNFDTELFLFDYAGNLLAANDDSSITSGADGSTSGLDSYINYAFQAPGKYVIGVGKYNSVASSGTLIDGTTPTTSDTYTDRYTLHVSLEAPGVPPTSPVKDTNSGLFAETQGAGNGGNITVRAGSIDVTKDARINAGVPQTNNIDTKLFLFDSAGTLLEENDDSNISSGAGGSTSSLDSYINYSFKQSGTYFIGVGGYPSSASNGRITGSPLDRGNYALQVSIGNPAFSNLPDGNGILNETELNDSRGTAQNIDSSFFLASDPNSNVELSTTIPYVSISGRGNGTFDYYSFTATAGNLGIFDIDTRLDRGSAGNITLDAIGEITIANSIITNSLEGATPNNTRSQIRITGASVSLTDNAQITSTVKEGSTGDGGNIDITAGSVSLTNNAQINASNSGSGIGGSISVQAINGGTITVDSSNISTSVTDPYQDGVIGQGGDITIAGGSVELTHQASLDASTEGQGKGGSISVQATTGNASFSLDNSTISTTVKKGATGDGGDIEITAGSVSLTNNAEINASNSGSKSGGDVSVEAINGGSVAVNGSTISTAVNDGAAGTGGDIDITGGAVSLDNSAQINASISGSGRGGNVSVEAVNGGAVSVANSSNIQTTVQLGATNQGGSIGVTAGSVAVTDGSRLSTQTRGEGKAGDIHINATQSVDISGANQLGLSSGLLTSTETAQSGEGGNITVEGLGNDPLDSLRVSNGGVLSARTRSSSPGGDITVSVNQLELTNGGQMIASALSSGKAGDITVNATQSVTVSGSNPNFIDFPDITVDPNNNGIVAEIEANDSINTAQSIALSSFSLQDNSGIESSTTIPHVSITSPGDAANDNSFDYYSFQVVTPGSQGIFDIDNYTDSSSLDSELFLFDQQGNLLANNDDSSTTSGADGSTTGLHSYISYTFGLPGAYFIGVGRYNSDASGGVITGQPLNLGDSYTLQVSIDNRDVNPNQGSNSGIFAQSQGTASAGNLSISTGQLTLQDSGQATVSSTSGIAGNLDIKAQSIALNNNASLTATNQSSLIGGNITLQGLNSQQPLQSLEVNNSLISASTVDGKAGTLSVNTAESVNLNGTGGLSVEATGIGSSGNLIITTLQLAVEDGAKISASTNSGRGGDITLQGVNTLEVNDSLISASTQTGQAGDLIVNAAESVRLSGTFNGKPGGLSVQAIDGGKAGFMSITTGELTVTDGASATVSSTGTGTAGSLDVRARSIAINNNASLSATNESSQVGGNITLEGIDNQQPLETVNVTNSLISASTQTGRAGNLSVNASESVNLRGTGGLAVSASNGGSAGSLSVTTQEFTVTDGASATVSSTGTGTAGSLNVTAQTVALNNQARLSAETAGGSGGNIELEGLNTLQVNNSLISASTQSGTAGNLSVNAIESVRLNGTLADGTAGGLAVSATNGGSAGSLSVTTGELTVENGAQATVSSTGTGTAGSLNVNAQTVALNNQARLSAETEAGSGGNITLEGLNTLNVNNSRISASTQNGTAGDVTINTSDSVHLRGEGGLYVEATNDGIAGNLRIATGDFIVSNGAQATVSSPEGQAGNLTVTANSMRLNRGKLTAETGGGEGGANILLNISDILWMQNESLISANASGAANGGNITINTTFIIALPPQGPEGSDIVANAFQGNGGKVNITAQGILNIQFRPTRTPLNDITASSQFGVAGVVAINTPNVDPSRGLTSLPTDLVDPTGLIDRSCQAGGGEQTGQFTVTGRGGLPPNPNEPLGEEGLLEDLGTPASSSNGQQSGISTDSLISSSSTPAQIIEAQGWVKQPDGSIILVAQTSSAAPHSPRTNPASCQITSHSATTLTASPR